MLRVVSSLFADLGHINNVKEGLPQLPCKIIGQINQIFLYLLLILDERMQ